MEINEIQMGNIRKEGGRMNYTKPLLIENGKKIAVACGLEIRILNVSDGRHVSTLNLNKDKIVGIAHDGPDHILSCDAHGELYRWHYTQQEIQCENLGSFPIPDSGVVENIAYVGPGGDLALVVMMNRGVGPRELLLQRDRRNFSTAKFHVLVSDVAEGTNKFSFSPGQSWCSVISISHSGLACYVVPVYKKGGKQHHKKKTRRILMGNREPTCVATHPTEEAIAVGDHFGGIELYYDIFQEQPRAKRRLHWHHMPVLDLIFTPHTGAELYSCGHEGALVQWHLLQGAKSEREVLPRLGQPMTHMALSNDAAVMVASHTDNNFSLISLLEWRLSSVILGQGVAPVQPKSCAKSVTDGATTKPLLAYDNRTGAVVTKAKPGYFHFYHAQSQQQLFLVDVVQENFVSDASGERDVTAMSLSTDGCTMATVDSVAGRPRTQHLKFWTFDHTKQGWRLDSSILCPHTGEVGECLLQPLVTRVGEELGTERPLCLTWSTAGDVMIWTSDEVEGVSRWCTLHHNWYRNGVSAGCASWSPCGTLAAVAYGPAVTVWALEPQLQCQCHLSSAAAADDITALRFSPSLHHPVVVTASASGLVAWSLVSRAVLYTVPLHGTMALEADPCTGLMAVATRQGEIVVFRAEAGEALATVDCGSISIAALQFCPSTQARYTASRLLYYTADMELFSVAMSLYGTPLDDDAKEDNNNEDGVGGGPRSKLSILKAETKTELVEEETIFAFRHMDRHTYVRPNIFTQEFEEMKVSHSISSFSDLLLQLAAKMDSDETK